MLPCLDPDATYTVPLVMQDGADTGVSLQCRYMSVRASADYQKRVRDLIDRKGEDAATWYDGVFDTLGSCVRAVSHGEESHGVEWLRDALTPMQAYEALLLVMGTQITSEIDRGKSLLPRGSGTTRGSAPSAAPVATA